VARELPLQAEAAAPYRAGRKHIGRNKKEEAGSKKEKGRSEMEGKMGPNR